MINDRLANVINQAEEKEKEMKVTNNEIINSVGSLRAINDIEVPFTLSYKIAKLIKQIDPILKAHEETNKKIIEKFTKKDAEGKRLTKKIEDGEGKEIEVWDIDNDNPDFHKELISLGNVENEIEVKPIDPSEFEDVDIKPGLLIPIMWLLEEGKKSEVTGPELVG